MNCTIWLKLLLIGDSLPVLGMTDFYISCFLMPMLSTLYDRAKMALYRSPDYQTSFKSIDLSIQEKKFNIPPTKVQKEVRAKSRDCHNHKPQPILDTKRKRKQTKPNKCKSKKCMKSTKLSSLFPKRDNCSAKRTEKYKNKVTQGKT